MKKSKRYQKGFRIIIFLTGLFSLLWFLIRVIPKPSRALYPCQRAAFPVASAFVIWLAGLAGSAGLLRMIRIHWVNHKYFQSVIAGLILLIVCTQPVNKAENSYAAASLPDRQFVPEENANTPVGIPAGIFPGRVTWVFDPNACQWDGISGKYFSGSNTIQDTVDTMIGNSLRWLTGAGSSAAAWDKLFRFFNMEHQAINVPYTAGEKIVVKINMNNCATHGTPDNQLNTTPQMVLGLLRQLVNQAGVPDTCITFYDISRKIPSPIFDPCKAEFPGVNFMDDTGGEGRIPFTINDGCEIKWSNTLYEYHDQNNDGTPETNTGGNPTLIPDRVAEARYLINLGGLKGHNLAGFSACAKNHFGSFYAFDPETGITGPKAAGVHPYVAVHDFAYWKLPAREMATYNPLVDLMGFKELGGKTLLYIIDGLYASQEQNGTNGIPAKWQMGPFNGGWTSSVFMSQDGVAIESVILDFLRSEPSMFNVYGNVDNYLHEAAMADNPPSETFYDPDGEGKGLSSLGVHEHWNNPEDKQYSGNLGLTGGIELVCSDPRSSDVDAASTASNPSIRIYPNPVKDILNIKLNGLIVHKLEIYTSTGEKIYHKDQGIDPDLISIPVSVFQPGTYIIKLYENRGSSVMRFIKD